MDSQDWTALFYTTSLARKGTSSRASSSFVPCSIQTVTASKHKMLSASRVWCCCADPVARVSVATKTISEQGERCKTTNRSHPRDTRMGCHVAIVVVHRGWSCGSDICGTDGLRALRICWLARELENIVPPKITRSSTVAGS